MCKDLGYLWVALGTLLGSLYRQKLRGGYGAGVERAGAVKQIEVAKIGWALLTAIRKLGFILAMESRESV